MEKQSNQNIKNIQKQLHLAADQGTIHSRLLQQVLDKQEQHLEHDKEPEMQRSKQYSKQHKYAMKSKDHILSNLSIKRKMCN